MVDWEQKKSKNKFPLLNLEVRNTEFKAELANQCMSKYSKKPQQNRS